MTLSRAILSAIDAAVKATDDGTDPTGGIRVGYMKAFDAMVEEGMTEEQIIAEFTQIANQQNQ